MIKSARKPSSDPVQEKLRQSKAVWNKEVSIFVNDLIHCKKLMNGWPNKFNMEKSMIKDPIPADPATIIGSLANDFNDIAQKGNNIVKQQLEYSKTRRKKQPKQLNLPLGTPSSPPTPSSTPDLSSQLSLPLTAAFEEKYGLVAEGSNKLTRFFTKLLTPTFGLGEAARIRKYRMNLLDACVRTYKDLGKLQVEIVKSSKSSLTSSNKLLHKTWNDWMVIYRGYSLYKSNMPKEVKDTGGEISITDKKNEDFNKPTTSPLGNNVAPTDRLQPSHDYINNAKLIGMVNMIIDDCKLSQNKFPEDAELFADLSNSFTLFLVPTTPEKKNVAADNIINHYTNMLKILRKKYNSNGTTLEAIANDKLPTTTAALEKVAQDFLRRWVGKTRHELSMFDKTSQYRLDIYKSVGELRKVINQIMDSLEKGMNLDELDPLIIQVNRDITSLRGVMRALNNAEPPPPKSSRMPDPENMGMMDRMNMLEKYM